MYISFQLCETNKKDHKSNNNADFLGLYWYLGQTYFNEHYTFVSTNSLILDDM